MQCKTHIYLPIVVHEAAVDGLEVQVLCHARVDQDTNQCTVCHHELQIQKFFLSVQYQKFYRRVSNKNRSQVVANLGYHVDIVFLADAQMFRRAVIAFESLPELNVP